MLVAYSECIATKYIRSSLHPKKMLLCVWWEIRGSSSVEYIMVRDTGLSNIIIHNCSITFLFIQIAKILKICKKKIRTVYFYLFGIKNH